MIKKALVEFRNSPHFKWFVLMLFLNYAGIMCNLIVVNLNGGMPIVGLDTEYVRAGIPLAANHVYVPIMEATKLSFLGDIWVFGDHAFSVGDFLMFFSIVGYLINGIFYIVSKYLSERRLETTRAT